MRAYATVSATATRCDADCGAPGDRTMTEIRFATGVHLIVHARCIRLVPTPPAHGRLTATPWARDALGRAELEGNRNRVPAGFTVAVSAQSPTGPYRASVIQQGAPVSYSIEHPNVYVAVDSAIAFATGQAVTTR